MDEALRVFSWRGFLTESVKATDIKSRADARNKGPFADHHRRRVGWVRWSQIEKTGRWRRAYFRHYPKRKTLPNIRKEVAEEVERMNLSRSESIRHKKAKECLAQYLKRLIQSKTPLKWGFVDKRVSSFPITGDLLADVEDVQTEYTIHTPFGVDYKFDIALLGGSDCGIGNEPIILGAIEIELTHEFEMSKCLICKALGFPLVCIDISDSTEAKISEDWIVNKLVETTKTSLDERRRNYIYIHDMLYPVFMNLPVEGSKYNRHQYIVFIKDDHFETLLKELNKLKESFGFLDNEVLIQPVPCKNAQMLTMLQNEGSIAGHDWQAYNSWRYIRVTLDRPQRKKGLIYRYHLAMSRLLNAHYDTLVGYKFRLGVKNDKPKDPIWHMWVKEGKGMKEVPILPKNVSEPLGSIIEIINSLD